MKKLVIGILAHVDSGKTTLSEAILHHTGAIRALGRVDHKDTFLDTDELERERGITIFSKEARFETSSTSFTLLDTPGHVDFSQEAERTLSVLDYAILVVSGSEKVQSHTVTLYNLLNKYNIPTFIFVNKMDISHYTEDEILNSIKSEINSGAVSFSTPDYEEIASTDEILMNLYLEEGEITREDISYAIKRRSLFPVFFGSALKEKGVDALLSALDIFTLHPYSPDSFGARVYKITEDERGNRLTHMKITGGTLSARSEISKGSWSEKVNEIRLYSGVKYQSTGTVTAGDVCAVTGLSHTFPGEGLGFEETASALSQVPLFSYSVTLPEGVDPLGALNTIKKLEEEETGLNITWNEQTKEISLSIMGEVQLEVLKRIIKSRFDLDVDFTRVKILYKETIRNTVEGVGHYEPLRHYAEVHLRLEPGKRGTGLIFDTDCSEEVLAKNWQNLILTHLNEKRHKGVLTGSPITDMKITLVSGKAHLKHTEGGDFRQATYRAVRQGLMQAESVLLEPWYDFTITLPNENVGRLMTDITRMGGEISAPEMLNEALCVLKGSAPISGMHGYDMTLSSYTRGTGRLECVFAGYGECPESEEAILNIGYDPEADLYNSPDSVFCAGGAGFSVKWYDVEKYMHLGKEKTAERVYKASVGGGKAGVIDEDELIRIFEATYGKIERKLPQQMKTVKKELGDYVERKKKPQGSDYLLIDGYNIIYSDENLKKAAASSLADARNLLIDIAETYNSLKQIEVIVVFDAYRVKGNQGSVESHGNINVVYTKEAETADAYIEKVTHELVKNHRVRVATSDNLEQVIILGNNALRMSAREFFAEIKDAEREIRSIIHQQNIENKSLDNTVLTEEIIKKLTEN
ncbi:MAG: TetM/TetW/TetO/TetS family tetracycline resistance ribosomal protection protein [Clostridia bacterium]|nr:TetM/TetW/TetO/TetS family tetracycline resistance ribosomal protection protein [Clostridia bacterium]